VTGAKYLLVNSKLIGIVRVWNLYCAWFRASSPALCVTQSFLECVVRDSELPWLCCVWLRASLTLLCVTQSFLTCTLHDSERHYLRYVWIWASLPALCVTQSFLTCTVRDSDHLIWIVCNSECLYQHYIDRRCLQELLWLIVLASIVCDSERTFVHCAWIWAVLPTSCVSQSIFT
jgi:hypothetical protein